MIDNDIDDDFVYSYVGDNGELEYERISELLLETNFHLPTCFKITQFHELSDRHLSAINDLSNSIDELSEEIARLVNIRNKVKYSQNNVWSLHSSHVHYHNFRTSVNNGDIEE